MLLCGGAAKLWFDHLKAGFVNIRVISAVFKSMTVQIPSTALLITIILLETSSQDKLSQGSCKTSLVFFLIQIVLCQFLQTLKHHVEGSSSSKVIFRGFITDGEGAMRQKFPAKLQSLLHVEDK